MSEKEYPVKIDEAELAKRVDPLSYAVFVMQQPKLPLPVNTPRPRRLVFTSAKRAAPNCLEVKPSFIQAADGHLFMHQLKTMPLSS